MKKGKKSLNKKNAYYQVFKNLDNMRYIIEKFTQFHFQIEFFPSLIFNLYLQ